MEQKAERWRRPFIEAVVIVLSILAAFAIDAWWEGAQERSRARGEIRNLASEFEAVDRELGRAAAELEAALSATLQLARLAGPAPMPIAVDSLGMLVVTALTINAVELPTGALTNLLAAGELPILRDLELQNRLASWPSLATLMSVKFAYLVANRDQHVLPLMNQHIALSPALSAAFRGGWSDEHHFAFDSASLLSNREFENLMAERWISIQIAALTVADAQALTRGIVDGLADWQ